MNLIHMLAMKKPCFVVLLFILPLRCYCQENIDIHLDTYYWLTSDKHKIEYPDDEITVVFGYGFDNDTIKVISGKTHYPAIVNTDHAAENEHLLKVRRCKNGLLQIIIKNRPLAVSIPFNYTHLYVEYHEVARTVDFTVTNYEIWEE